MHSSANFDFDQVFIKAPGLLESLQFVYVVRGKVRNENFQALSVVDMMR